MTSIADILEKISEVSAKSLWKPGFTWNSSEGVREVVRITIDPRSGETVYAVTTAGGLAHLLRDKEIALEIRRDSANYESRQRLRKSETQRMNTDQEAARWGGFTDGMTPTAKARTDAALARQVSVRGMFESRGKHIQTLVSEGFRVIGHRLEDPSGSFFDEKSLTKTGLDYAKFLSGDR